MYWITKWLMAVRHAKDSMGHLRNTKTETELRWDELLRLLFKLLFWTWYRFVTPARGVVNVPAGKKSGLRQGASAKMTLTMTAAHVLPTRVARQVYGIPSR